MIGPNFVFVHINKTGGSSIERALRRHGIKKGGDTHAEFQNKVKFQHAQHFIVKDYIEVLGSEYWDKFSCAIVRNPWDRMLSYYAFSHRKIKNISKEDFSIFILEVFTDQEVMKHLTMCSLEANQAVDCFDHERMFKPCTYWLEGGVDLIGRFENLQRAYDIICDNIKIPFHKKRILSSEKHSFNRRKDYRFYYTDEAAAVIEEKFMSDIKAFGYTFDGITR